MLSVCLDHIEPSHTASKSRHEAGNKLLAKFGQGGHSLQLTCKFGGVGFDPALFVHRRGALLEDLDRARQGPRLIRHLCEWNLLCVIAARDRLD